MKEKDTPMRRVRWWSGLIPNVYEQMDRLKTVNGSNKLVWPNLCYLPIAAAITILRDVCGVSVSAASDNAADLTACYIWSKNKTVYSFDKDLSQLLATQVVDFKDTSILPAEVLTHPPHPCTFIETDFFHGCCGFWYWIEYDLYRKALEIRIQFVSLDFRKTFPHVLHLLPGKSLQECLDDTAAERARYQPSRLIEKPKDDTSRHRLLVALQFILYLMSENADIQDIPSKKAVKNRKRKKAHRISDKANKVNEKLVGVRIGNAIRKARASSHSSPQGSTGFTKRPHSRRGHWHHYWVGPRDGERSLILKWVAPTIIHENAFRNDMVVVFPVKQ